MATTMKTRILPLEEALDPDNWTDKMFLVGASGRIPFAFRTRFGWRPNFRNGYFTLNDIKELLNLGVVVIEEEIPQPSLKELLGPGWVSVDSLEDKPHWQRVARLTRRTDLFIIVFNPARGYWGTCADSSEDVNEIVEQANKWAEARGGWAE